MTAPSCQHMISEFRISLSLVNMYNDLFVDGSVNNITFDEHTLLLREHDQVLRGPVRIRNKFSREQRILANNFENLRVDAVNGWSVQQFFDNQAKMGSKAHVQGALVFNNPLRVTEFRSGDGNIYRDWRNKRRVGYDVENKTAAGWPKLERAVRILHKSYVATNYILEDFQVHQTLKIAATNLILLPLRLNKEFIDVIGIFNDTKEEHLQFYAWDKNTNQFHVNKNLSWLPHEKLQLNILNVAFRRDDYLQVAKTGKDDVFQQNIITNDTEGLERVLKMKNSKNSELERFEMQNEDCFAIYSNESDEVSLYCLEHPKKNANLEIAPKGTIKKLHVKQILALSAESIALLFEDAVEIWNTSYTLELVQRIALVKAKQIAVGVQNKVTYLAVISEITEKTLHYGTVELYSARYMQFTHLQTINCINPIQIEFSQIQQSSDLLLHILSASYEQPLMVYQYKGVAGFQQIVAASTLPTAKRMFIMQLRSTQQHLIALLSEQEITFVEIKLKKI